MNNNNKDIKKIITNFINGKDIEEYQIEALENDKDFMKSVIEETNDKNFYNLCSDQVKNDYEMVKYLINKFSSDINFICKVADNYLKNTDDEVNKFELSVTMSKLIKDKNIEKYDEYNSIIDNKYKVKRVEAEIIKEGLRDIQTKNKLGMGFALVLDSYDNKNVIDTFAKKFISEIFSENNTNLEDMLHQHFNNFEKLDKTEMNNYLISFISKYDSVLAIYINSNENIKKELLDEVINVQKKWNICNKLEENKKYNLILDKVHEYMEQESTKSFLSETQLLYYVGKQLGIIEKIAKYDNIKPEIAVEITNSLDEELIQHIIKESPNDLKNYNTIREIIESIIFENKLGKFSDNKKTSGNKKLLKINFNNDKKDIK